MKQQCQQLQTSLLQEDGVGTAVDLISQHVKLTCTPQVDAMFLQPPAGDCAQQHEHADGVQPDADSQVHSVVLLCFLLDICGGNESYRSSCKKYDL